MFECWQDLLCQGTPVGCQASQPVPPSGKAILGTTASFDSWLCRLDRCWKSRSKHSPVHIGRKNENWCGFPRTSCARTWGEPRRKF
jgi:hypothetical protein